MKRFDRTGGYIYTAEDIELANYRSERRNIIVSHRLITTKNGWGLQHIETGIVVAETNDRAFIRRWIFGHLSDIINFNNMYNN